ncbi:MAG: AI-2E family transporter [Lysobacterales bacterium]
MSIEAPPESSPAALREAAAPRLAAGTAEPPEVAGTSVAPDVTPDPAVVRNRLLGTIVVLLALYTCALAEAVIVPIVVAILLGLILAPAVRALSHVHVPRAIGALVAVVLTFALIGVAFMALANPARAWMARMPQALAHVETTLRDLRRPLQAATEATREIGKLANPDAASSVRMVDASPGLLTQFLNAAPTALAGLIITVFLTFLFLLHGDTLLRKFVTMAPHLRAKRDLVMATRQAQHELSLYMITITLINAGLGIATAITLRLMHVPDPMLWGGVAALMNFAPFIGPLLTAIVLAVAGFAQSASPLVALAAPAAFLGLHLIEGQLVTPHLVGRRLALDPVMVFVALVVLGWLWGVAGLLLAVPLLSCAKIVSEHTGEDHILATLLSH